MKKLIFIFAIAITASIFVGCAAFKTRVSEQELTLAVVKELIEQKDFLFEATRATAMQGTSKSLTSEYSARISGDTLDVYLPYYGRSYSAPLDPTNLGIKFMSTDFTYKVEQRKNKSFNVIITPKDLSNSDLRGIVLYFNIFESGSSSLNINMTNRQPINFTGEIKSNEKP